VSRASSTVKVNPAVRQAKFNEVSSYRGGVRRGAHLGGSWAAGSIKTRRATIGLHARPSAVMQAHGRSPPALSLAQSVAVRCPKFNMGPTRSRTPSSGGAVSESRG
jgi:hypothetical protein